MKCQQFLLLEVFTVPQDLQNATDASINRGANLLDIISNNNWRKNKITKIRLKNEKKKNPKDQRSNSKISEGRRGIGEGVR